MGNAFDLERLGVSQENLDRWKREYLELFKTIKKITLDKANYPKLFPLLRRLIIVSSNLSNLAFLKENDNKNKIYLAAEKFLAAHPLLISDLEKFIVESMPKHELDDLCSKLELADMIHYFNNVREYLRDFIPDEKMDKLTPLIIEQTNISQVYDRNANKYKSKITEIIVDNLSKSDDAIFKLITAEAKRVEKNFLKLELEQYEHFARLGTIASVIQKELGYDDEIDEATKAYGLGKQVRAIALIWEEFESLKNKFKALDRQLVDKIYSPQHDIAYGMIYKLRHSPLKTVDEMKTILKTSFERFSPMLAKFLTEKIMVEGKYDTEIRDSKARGMAFTLTNEDGENFVSSHYDKAISWQRVLAHEWGHALHGELTNETFVNAEHQVAIVEGPSTLAELIYSYELLKEANDPKVKICIISLLLEELLSRLSYAPKMITFINEMGLRFKPEWTKEDYVQNALEIKAKLHWNDEKDKSILDLSEHYFVSHLPSTILLFQYILADAEAWINYNNLLKGQFDLEALYTTPLRFTDLVSHYKNKGFDINSPLGFNQLKPILEALLAQYQQLIETL